MDHKSIIVHKSMYYTQLRSGPLLCHSDLRLEGTKDRHSVPSDQLHLDIARSAFAMSSDWPLPNSGTTATCQASWS